MATNKKQTLSVLIGILISLSAWAQIAPKVKYWVKLTNKTGTPYSIAAPSGFLSQKAITRRAKYNIPYHPSDLPVTPLYLANIDTVNHVHVLYASKWLNGLVVAIDSAVVAPTALAAISSFTFVQNTSKVNKYKLNGLPYNNNVNPSMARTASTEVLSVSYGGSGGQNRQLKIDSFHNKGVRGQGMTIVVMDVGFDNVDSSPTFDSLRNNGGILGTRDFVDGGTNAYRGGSHGTMVLSCIAANKPGIAVGTAPMASFWLLRTEQGSSETISEEYNWVRAAEFADSVGADILTTSLGYTEFDNPAQNHSYATLNGRTAPMSIAANMAARKGMFVLNAAGNEGNSAWKYIGVAADADSICTVGAVDTLGVYASFSSIGPTADGRIKPDLVACGAGAWVCDASNNCFGGNGTSFATPIMAGAVALYWQSNPQLNNIRLLDTLRKIGSNAKSPNNKIGWGIPNMRLPATSLITVQPEIDFDFTVYANPANSIISIKLSKTNFSNLNIEVIDGTGKPIIHSISDIPDRNATVHLNGHALPDGIYFVKVSTSKGIKVRKFLKQ